MVSAPRVPVIFSKLVAPAVDNVNAVVLSPLSSNCKVSRPEPPSSFIKLALVIVGVPLDPVSIREMLSSPAPISIESPSFNLAELKVSLPAFIIKV